MNLATKPPNRPIAPATADQPAQQLGIDGA